jgi:three-Cys-motif partner protein
MATTNFFADQIEQSRTKARIVSKYFDGWSNVIGPIARKRGGCIQYVDLFAGPGRYDGGADSTPLLVLRMALAKPKIHDIFVGVFNDSDPANAAALDEAIDTLPGIGLLKHRPRVYNDPVDEQVTALFESRRLAPTLTFIDPFGYKGLSMRLIRATLKDWGCDCIFFFNFNRVNAAIHNADIEQHVAALFDAEDACLLRRQFAGLRPQERETKVMEALEAAVKKEHGKHVLHFGFLNDAASRTSHHLVFATKHPLGCKIMKDIMAKESSWSEGGVPSFVCSPRPKERGLFDDLGDPAAELEAMLLETFAGQSLTVGEIYEQHGLSRRFMPPNYKEALKRLEAAGRVTAFPPADERRPGTMADHVVIQFPKRAD